MSIDIGIVVVSEATPSGSISSDPSMNDWLWLKPSTGAFHNYDGATGQWVEVTHLHPSLGDIEFTGTITAGGELGLTGEYEGTFKKIKVVDGIVTELELE